MFNKAVLALPILASLLSGVVAHPGEDHTEEIRELAEKRDFFRHSHRSLQACSGGERKRAIEDEWATRRANHIQELRSAIAAKKQDEKKRKMKKRVVKRTTCNKRTTSSSLSSSAISSTSTSSADSSSSSGGASAGGSSGGGDSTTLSDYGESLLNTTHQSNRTDITANITSADLFDSSSSSNGSCLLQPEATIGPYWVAGEYVRDNITETQAGVPIYMSAQFLDVSTCDPISNMYWEVWHCNATGVYSGVVSSGNGDTSDTANLNKTFLRGMSLTDDLGVAEIASIFPGHYTGRATHVHIVGHTNATLLANGTIGTGSTGDGNSTTVHIGQIFYDQDLITAVEATSPYSTNTQTLTTNAEDSIFAGEAVEGAPDPIMSYVYLGDSVEDGIYAWITIGVDASSSYETTAASYLTSDGGVSTGSSVGGSGGSSGGSGGGQGGSNGTAPSGGMQSGSAPSGSMPSGSAPSMSA